MTIRPGPWLIAALMLTACQQRDSDPGPGGVTIGEARALDEAAEMIEQRRAPDGVNDEVLDASRPKPPVVPPENSVRQ